MRRPSVCVLAVLLMGCVVGVAHGESNYMIGAGIADCTGPAGEINMMGYASPTQTTRGIHLRQYSRAFIISESDGSNPIVFVSVDVAMISQLMRIEVIDHVTTMFGDRYPPGSIMLSATHTHSSVAGFHQYVLYEVTSLGFVPQTLESLVDGVVRSIERAHANLQAGDIFMNSGELLEANINRSPIAYDNNPEEEKERYKYNTDTEMTLLKLVDAEGQGIGMINWYPVHPTSMNNTNRLISSDNKGLASIMFEREENPGKLEGQGGFVAAFAQANLGDVSPNLKGPKCIDTGLPCDILKSTCDDDKVQKCIASGPGDDMFASTRIIAERHHVKARELYAGAKTMLSGPVDHRFQFVDMTNVTVTVDGKEYTTCKPSMGYSFAAGTTDGPGALNFTQGDTTGDPFWDSIVAAIKEPSPELRACQHPKPVLLPTGEMTWPYMWQPEVADFQLLRVGQLIIMGVPGEFTTMAGRRAREAVQKALIDNGFPKDTTVVLAGLSNSYTSYITTFEEYQIQRYEGASTIYGPHTHRAMTDTLVNLAKAMAKGEPVAPGPSPPNLKDDQVSFVPPVLLDRAPSGYEFGDVLVDVHPQYSQGDIAFATFVSGNPRNNLQLEETFLSVEQQQEDGSWKVVAKDSAWETKYHWDKESITSTLSKATVEWAIPESQAAGTYKLRTFGHYKNIFGTIKSYTGESAQFTVAPKQLTKEAYRQKYLNAINKYVARRI